jgi:hypothetical protein
MHRHLQIAMRGRSVTDVQEDRPAGDEHVSRRLYNNSSLALRHPHEPLKNPWVSENPMGSGAPPAARCFWAIYMKLI